MHSKILLNPVLKVNKSPMDKSHLYLANKIQVKYGFSRGINKFSKLILRNMFIPLNKDSHNNVLINKYISCLEVYKPVFNIEARLLNQLLRGSKEIVYLHQNILSNMIFKGNRASKLKEKTYKEFNNVNNKKVYLSKIFDIYFGMRNSLVNTLKNTILNYLNNESLFKIIHGNKYGNIIYNTKANIGVITSNNINKILAQSIGRNLKEIHYIELTRDQEIKKNIYIQNGKLNREKIQTIDRKLYPYKNTNKNTNNNMQILEKLFRKVYRSETKNKDIFQHTVTSREVFSNFYVNNISIIDNKTNDRTYEFFSLMLKNKNYLWKVNKLVESIVTKSSKIKSQEVNSPLNLKHISSFTKDFYVKNINRTIHSQLVEDIYNKLIVNSHNDNEMRIFKNMTRDIKRENIEVYKSNNMIYLKPPKKETKDSDVHEIKKVKPIENESYSRTFFAEKKENRSFTDLDACEINILADKVYKVIEKRIEIRRDRRGVR